MYRSNRNKSTIASNYMMHDVIANLKQIISKLYTELEFAVLAANTCMLSLLFSLYIRVVNTLVFYSYMHIY